MTKHNIEEFDLTLYKEVLPNGLTIYALPNDKAGNIHVTFSARFGSYHREFIPSKKEKMIKVPAGIAHFLEHKKFEQETGDDPFTFYEKRGVDANANTTFYKTTYLFSGLNHFEECLNYLLDYVQSPYFTDENVESEKGIIEQEIKMVADSPYAEGVDMAIKNCFKNHPLCDTVLGKIKDIRSITKEDLYDCYNTFYHPSNMFVVITGKFDVEKAISIIRKNQAKKKFMKKHSIQMKEYCDTKEVSKKEEIIEKNVSIPKTIIAYKVDTSVLKDLTIQEIDWCIELFLELKFDVTSSFSEIVKEKNILSEEIEYATLRVGDKMIILFIADTFEADKLIEQIDLELKNIEILQSDFNSKKKKRIADSIYMSDDIYGLNNYIMADIIKYQEFSPDFMKKIKNIEFKNMVDSIQKLSFNQKAIVKILPKNAN